MNANRLLTILPLVVLSALILMGLGTLIVMSASTGANTTPAQNALIQMADGVIKVSFGALLGLVAGLGLRRVRA